MSISAGLVAKKRGGFGGRGFTFESSELSRNQQQRKVEMDKAKAEVRYYLGWAERICGV